MSTTSPQDPSQTVDSTTMPQQSHSSTTIPSIATSALVTSEGSEISPATTTSPHPTSSSSSSQTSTTPLTSPTLSQQPITLTSSSTTKTTTQTEGSSPTPQNESSSSSPTTTTTPPPPQDKTSSTTRNAIVSGTAGVISGFLATVLLHPLEVFKIRLQGDAAGKASYRFTLRDVINVSRRVGLYTGISANLIASMVAWGVFFGTNDYLRIHGRNAYTEYKTNQHNNTNQSKSPTGLGAAMGYGGGSSSSGDVDGVPKLNFFGVDFATSMLASTIAQIATQPLWLMKTRMSLDQIPLQHGTDINTALKHANEVKLNSPYRSLWRGLVHTGRTDGLRGLYRGFSASLLGTTHGAIMMCSYTYLKELKVVNDVLETQPEWLRNIILPSYAAFMSKVIATIVTYPTQVLRTSIQDHRVAAMSGTSVVGGVGGAGGVTSTTMPSSVGATTTQPLPPQLKPITPPLQPNYSLWHASKDIWRSSGIKGFYRGVSMQVLRASLQNVVVFGVYEGSRRFIIHETGVGGANTGNTNTSGMGSVKKD